MRTYKVFIFIKTIAITLFAMAAGAGCCYCIMAESQPYIMPFESISYEIETLPHENETLPHENETLPAGFKPPEHETDTVCAETQPVTECQTQVAPEQHIYEIPLSPELQNRVRELADQYELSYELVLAVIMTESSGRADTVGDGGDSIGLMQIQPKWYGELIAKTGLSVDKPVENVELGIRILLGFIEENNGSLDRALKQYNSGTPDYPGNEYIEKVYEWLDYFEEAADDGRTVDE
ncbi:MAG TPA: hypothetical protein DCY19_02250 [Eubacterium sp.]|nr:hypothetical protein [Eubacterium sp.]